MDANIVPLLVPIIIIELGLLALGLRDLIKRKQVKGGNKWVWGIVMFVGIIGPIVYFVAGRGEE